MFSLCAAQFFFSRLHCLPVVLSLDVLFSPCPLHFFGCFCLIIFYNIYCCLRPSCFQCRFLPSILSYRVRRVLILWLIGVIAAFASFKIFTGGGQGVFPVFPSSFTVPVCFLQHSLSACGHGFGFVAYTFIEDFVFQSLNLISVFY